MPTPVNRWLLCLVLAGSLAPDISAQSFRDVRPFAIGGMVGPTSGTTFKVTFEENVDKNHTQSIDLNLTSDFDDYLLGSAHVTRNSPLPDSPMSIFLGPGFFMGFEGKEAFWGPSTNIGAFFVQTRYEVFFQIMPRIRITPDVRGEFGASVGMRYLF